MPRPVPVPTAETRPFWEGCRQATLILARCTECGRIPFPPRPRCPDCLTDQLEWVPLSGTGRLKGRSANHIARLNHDGSPTRVVEVCLTEDPRATLLALDQDDICRACPPDAPVTLGFDNSDPDCPLLTIACLGAIGMDEAEA